MLKYRGFECFWATSSPVSDPHVHCGHTTAKTNRSSVRALEVTDAQVTQFTPQPLTLKGGHFTMSSWDLQTRRDQYHRVSCSEGSAGLAPQNVLGGARPKADARFGQHNQRMRAD